MKETIAEVTINTKRTERKESEKVKEYREKKKEAHKEAIKNNSQATREKRDKYIRSQETLRNEIEETNKQAARIKIKKTKQWRRYQIGELLETKKPNRKPKAKRPLWHDNGRRKKNHRPAGNKRLHSGLIRTTVPSQRRHPGIWKMDKPHQTHSQKNRKNPRKSRTTTDHRWKKRSTMP